MRQQRAERLVSLLEVACLQKPVADDDETQVLREDQTPPVSPWRPKKAEPEEDSLGGMFKHLSCSRNLSSARADAELKRQVKELQRRRDAASKLIDEVEAEVMVLGEQLRERTSAENVVPESKAAAAKIGSYPEGWYLGFSQPWQDGNKHASAPSAASGVPFHYLPQWVPCGEDCAPRTDTRAIVSRSADLAAMMPAPALRCELQKNLADAHKEIADLQQEITALRREQGVNLFDGRRTDLAFTRGKHCGGQFAERVMEHFFIRTQTGAVFKAWRLKAQSCRRALRVDHLLASPGDQQLVEAFFQCLEDPGCATICQLVKQALGESISIFGKFGSQDANHYKPGDGAAAPPCVVDGSEDGIHRQAKDGAAGRGSAARRKSISHRCF